MATETYEKGKLYSIPLGNLNADPNQPRKYFDPDALEELAASIIKHGVLEPILFRQDTDGLLYVVAGERRAAAAGKAGLTTIPAIFVEGNHGEIALVENLLRQDLTAVEEAEALQGLMDVQKYTQEQLSAIIGKARSTIAEILTLNRLPEEVRAECRSNPAISRATLLEIARKKQTRSMVTVYNKYKEKVAKEGAGKQTRQKTAPSQTLIGWLEKTADKLTGLDTAPWTDEEKAALFAVITQVRDLCSALLVAPAVNAKTRKRVNA